MLWVIGGEDLLELLLRGEVVKPHRGTDKLGVVVTESPKTGRTKTGRGANS